MQNQTLTCIIVDDEIGNTVILSDYVSQIPYLNLKKIFQKPTEALVYLLKNPTDLLITDVNMPQLRGIELYKGIILHTHTQVIFITGEVNALMEAIQFPAVDYLLKPISFQRFEYATKKALGLAQVEIKIYEKISPEILGAI